MRLFILNQIKSWELPKIIRFFSSEVKTKIQPRLLKEKKTRNAPS